MSNGRNPDFIVIGAQKAGTTALHAMLRLTPGVFVPEKKELEYFSCDTNYAKGMEWYRAFFADAKPGQLCGEVSPQYAMWPCFPNAPERIARDTPESKLIFVMRHPVDRAYSHYRQKVKMTQRLGIRSTVEENFEVFLTSHPYLIACSNYMLQLDRYLAHFSKQRFLFIMSRDLRGDPNGTIDRIRVFLGVHTDAQHPDMNHIRANVGWEHFDDFVRSKTTAPIRMIPALENVRKKLPHWCKDAMYKVLGATPYGRRVRQVHMPGEMLPGTRQALLERFKEPTCRLEQFLRVDLSDWKA